MAYKIVALFLFLSVVLYVQAQLPNAPVDVEKSDILFIQNPDTAPVILSPEAALLSPARNNLVCTAAMCRSVCNALGFTIGRCNVNRVCVCSNILI